MEIKPLSLRVFHWLYALCFVLAYISADDDTLWLHVLCASWVFGLAIFRLLLFISPKSPWNISSFELRISALKEYIRGYFDYKGEKNPASSFMAVWLIFLGIWTPISGYLSNIGPVFAFLHELSAKVFVISVLLHLAGVVADGIFHQQKAYSGMISKDRKIESYEKYIFATLIIVLIAGAVLSTMYIDTSLYEDVETEFEDHD